ncbi:unnamed protein product [Urochloa humidicola]
MDQHLGNTTTLITLFHQLRDMWKSPRGTVLRIQALAVVAIALSFFLAVFGSCRRWSNRWIVQKGFLAAQVLSLSFGTYSIGLMQSSWVKNEMYPIWAVSLFSLFGCINPITNYIGLDYKGPFSRMIFQICLYGGYVLWLSFSTISSDIGKLAIGVLCAITFFKGFHKSLAFVLQRKTRDDIQWLVPTEPAALKVNGEGLRIHLRSYISERHSGKANDALSTSNIDKDIRKKVVKGSGGMTIEDVCLGYSLSHLLQRRFLGFDNAAEMKKKREKFKSLRDGGEVIEYKRTLKVIEVELAFLYDVYFTSNEFLNLYQAETASFLAIASFIGICIVGVVSFIPGTMVSHHRITTIVVDTTTADRIITLVVLVSLALLQLVQLVRCWTSNWARVAFASEYTWNQSNQTSSAISCGWWMRTKAFLVIRINWFDNNKYLWQDKLGQHSVVAPWSWGEGFWKCMEWQPSWMSGRLCRICQKWGERFRDLCLKCQSLLAKVGVHYILEVLGEMLVSDTTNNTADAMRLDCSVKECIADFLRGIKSSKIGTDWSSVFVNNGIDASWLPYSTAHLQTWEGTNMSDASAFTHRVMAWHIATCYCELADQEASAGGDRAKNRRVAIALSKYCAYLAALAPELLPGSSAETNRALDIDAREIKRAYGKAAWRTNLALRGKRDKLDAMRSYESTDPHDAFAIGVAWGNSSAALTPGRCWRSCGCRRCSTPRRMATCRRTCNTCRRAASLSHISGPCSTTSASTSGSGNRTTHKRSKSKVFFI